MLHRIRLELMVGAALAIAIAALVVAIRSGGSESTPENVADAAANAAEESVPADAAPEGAAEVRMMAISFLPDELRVEVGTPVVFRNLDQTAHDVTASDGSWGSGFMGAGDTFSKTFDEPGTYVYICTLHPPRQGAIFGAPDGATLVGGGGRGMQGTIIVE